MTTTMTEHDRLMLEMVRELGHMKMPLALDERRVMLGLAEVARLKESAFRVTPEMVWPEPFVGNPDEAPQED